MYGDFAKVAREEGFNDIAKQFELVMTIEKWHEERYKKLAQNIKDEKVFEKEKEICWRCGNCGYTIKGKTAPEVCPFCSHPQSYFEEKKENY